MQAGAFQGQAEQVASGNSGCKLLAKLCVKLLLNPRSIEGVVHGCVGVEESLLIGQRRYSGSRS
jgi:hypothetical protein